MCIITVIKPPEAETNTENTNRGIRWSQEDNDMLYGCVLYTHTDSENLLGSKEGLGGSTSSVLLASLVTAPSISCSEIRTSGFITSSTFSFIFSLHIYHCSKHFLSVSYVPGRRAVNQAESQALPWGVGLGGWAMRLIPGIQVVGSEDHFYKLSSGSACTSHHNKSINVKKKKMWYKSN